MTARLGPTRKQSVVRAAATVAVAIGVVAFGTVTPAAATERTIVRNEQRVSVSNDSGTTTTTVRQRASSSSGQVRVRTLRNEVEAKNRRRDGRVEIRSDFEIDKSSRPAVHAINTALAFASCVDCRTAALAFQVVLAEENVGLSADNHAAAINDRCTSCDTLAVAFQFVVAGPGELALSRLGRSQLRDLDRQVSNLRRSGATGAELLAASEAIAGQALAVLQSEITFEPSDALGPLSRSAGVSVQLYREVDTNPAP